MRRFEPADIDEVNGWCAARGLDPLDPAALPPVGFVEPGLAAGWLYRTDADLALVEGLVTNPTVPLRQRSRAVDAVTRALLDEAKAFGVRRVVAFCREPGVARRAVRLGFAQAGEYTMVAMQIGRC